MIAPSNRLLAAPAFARSVRLVVLPLLLAAGGAAAQPPAESGIARDARSSAPLACLHVALLDTADRAVAHTVTDSAGTFVLVAPEPGVFRVGFEIFGWERLVGPVDTLHAGDMRERVYPLEFTGVLRSDGGAPGDLIVALRRREGSGWHSAVAVTPDAPLRYPRAMTASRSSGAVVAQYVVGETGKVRAGSWRPIESTNAEFLGALRAHVPAMRYQPASLDGQPVCELVRNEVKFDWAPVPVISIFN